MFVTPNPISLMALEPVRRFSLAGHIESNSSRALSFCSKRYNKLLASVINPASSNFSSVERLKPLISKPLLPQK